MLIIAKGCTTTEKDRDGCPKIINLGSAKTDLFYERKKHGLESIGRFGNRRSAYPVQTPKYILRQVIIVLFTLYTNQ